MIAFVGRNIRSPLVALLLAIVMVAAAALHGGHAEGALMGAGQAHAQATADAAYHDQKPCHEQGGKAQQHGVGCLSASGCTLCVPIEAPFDANIGRTGAAPSAPLVVSSPGELRVRQRPPDLPTTV